jgi:hypothetical protein
MEAEQVDEVLRSLSIDLDGWGWWGELPESCGQFLGHRLGLEVYTRVTPGEGPPPCLTPAEAELVKAILVGLPSVLEQADERYRGYEAKYPEACEQLYAPRISISREELSECGPGRWALILKSRYGAPDWNLHIEFEKLSFRWIGQANEE